MGVAIVDLVTKPHDGFEARPKVLIVALVVAVDPRMEDAGQSRAADRPARFETNDGRRTRIVRCPKVVCEDLFE